MNYIFKFFFLLALFYSCNDMTEYHTYIHENGLHINVPVTYTNILKTDIGFSIGKLEDKDIRNPRHLNIKVLLNDSIIKSHNWKLLEADVFYRTEIHEGFSGGTLFIFQAWKKSDSKFIFLEEGFQNEFDSSPKFKVGKKIIIESTITLTNNNSQ